MISQVPFDVLHLRDLGVMIKIMFLILKCKKFGKLAAIEIDKITEILISLRSSLPCEFVRKPTGLDELCRWKAVEYRMFLYYLGPLIFNAVLYTEYALHFNSLHAAVTILSHSENYKENNACAHELLKWFVETFKTLYGEEKEVYTIHCLQHLATQVLSQDEPLDENSAYPFENYLQISKKMIRKPTDVLAQLFRRLVETSKNRNQKIIMNCYSRINQN